MRTIRRVEVKKDYDSNLSYQIRNEDIEYLISEIDVFCEIKNNKLINIVQKYNSKNTRVDDFKNSKVIEATGYSKSDWQIYKLYYNYKEIKDAGNLHFLKQLVKSLKRCFTHQNDYIATTIEVKIIEGKRYVSDETETESFYINTIEFPKEEDIIKTYVDYCANDFDEIVVKE